MSPDQPALERSVLERKDRDELLAIVEAIGAKAPSRARKADLVDLILETAGVGGSNGDGPAAADADAEAAAEAKGNGRGRRRPAGAPATTDAEADQSSDAENRAPAAGSGGAGDGDGGSTGADQGDRQAGSSSSTDDAPSAGDGSTAEAREPATAADRGEAPGDGSAGEESGRDQSAGNENRGGERGRGDRPARDRGGRDEGSGDNRSDNRGDGNRNRDNNREGGIQVVVAEPGNRRSGRRRRGRGGGKEPQQQQQREEVFQGEPVEVEGLLDLRDEGYGFVRVGGYLPSQRDVYVSVKQVRQFGMRKGDLIKGTSRPALRDEKNPALLRIDAVNGEKPVEGGTKRPRFEDLTPLFPDQKLHLERPEEPHNMTSRIVDLISPIGKGQRGLIVSPPKAGKTTVMKEIAHSIEQNNPEVHLMVLLVDERPEEVTDMRRSVKTAEVIASTFDRPSEEHTQVAELSIERAKRLVEEGRDVVIILDGITRLARAYNLAAPATGRIMSGGVDSGALYPPKKFFGAARNIEEGGSLTILATALIETGSKMDEVIFEEFKGTGNMELRLDRRLAERRIYPAIDVDASSTRHEELLFDRKQLQQVWKLRRVLSGLASDNGAGGAGLELLIDRMKTFKNNDEFLAEIAKAGPAGA